MLTYADTAGRPRQLFGKLIPFCLTVLFALSMPLQDAGAAAGPTAQTEQGILSGLQSAGVDEFLGVRYALPPTGALRWQPPVPVPPSAAAIQATQFGSNCAQNSSPWGTPSTAEDCLFLNVYAPAGAQHGRGHSHPLPVMVWIHGGGFIAGQGSAYDPLPLVNQGVVVVTINHRLGALGLFAHPALDGEHHLIANYALMDQQLALKWVQRNIAAFGGDSRNVTLFGESSGGIAIYSHLASPLSSHLFQKAIIESGAPDYITLPVAEASGVTLAQQVGCASGTARQIAACLRQTPVSALLAHQATPTGGIVDGQLLPQPPAQAIANEQYNHVPLINGTNHYEGRLIAAFLFDLSGAPLQASGYAAALATISNFLPGTGYPLSAIPAIAQQYALSKYPSPDLAAAAVITDGTIACPAYEEDKVFARSVPVWSYEFRDDKAPEIVAPPVSFPYEATHFSELQYLFDTSALTLPGTPALSPAQHRLSADMVRYWTAFAADSDPNGSARAPYWRNFDRGAKGPIQALDTPRPHAESDFAAEHQCDFWKELRASF